MRLIPIFIAYGPHLKRPVCAAAAAAAAAARTKRSMKMGRLCTSVMLKATKKRW